MPDDIWSIRRAFDWTRNYLHTQGDSQARLSTEWLLADACGLSRIEVYTHFDKPLSEEERVHLRQSVKRRASGEPLQYITGTVGFRHLTLAVRPGVLIPRPETEVLVDLALELLPAANPDKQLMVLDVCTGSGCVGLALASERPDVRVIATDICEHALALAEENASICQLSERFTTVQADLFTPIKCDEERGREADCSCRGERITAEGSGVTPASECRAVFDKDQGQSERVIDLITANPPYIPSAAAGMDALPKEVADFEPLLALDGGPDGLSYARRILLQAPDHLRASGGLVLELDARNVHHAADFAVQLKRYKKIDIRSDLCGRQRFVTAVVKGT